MKSSWWVCESPSSLAELCMFTEWTVLSAMANTMQMWEGFSLSVLCVRGLDLGNKAPGPRSCRLLTKVPCNICVPSGKTVGDFLVLLAWLVCIVLGNENYSPFLLSKGPLQLILNVLPEKQEACTKSSSFSPAFQGQWREYSAIVIFLHASVVPFLLWDELRKCSCHYLQLGCFVTVWLLLAKQVDPMWFQVWSLERSSAHGNPSYTVWLCSLVSLGAKQMET